MLLPEATPVRLMVLNEVTTHTAHAGDRFPLLVDRAVVIGGATLIAAGTRAWGEVVTAHENGSAGKAGKLGAHLLWIALPGGQVPLADSPIEITGAGAGVQTVAAAAGFGMLAPLALLARGNNAKLKAGQIVEGSTAHPLLIDPANGTVTPPPPPLTP